MYITNPIILIDFIPNPILCRVKPQNSNELKPNIMLLLWMYLIYTRLRC
jgi:hypothetical protein